MRRGDRGRVRDVVVIGGGWSGLLSIKHARQEGLDAIALEARRGLGGVWRYSADPRITTVMQETRASSSASLTEASDFPMPDRIGNFPRHDEVLDYLESYASSFGLLDRMRFGCRVSRIRREGSVWHLQTTQGRILGRHLVLATGTAQRPNRDLAELRGFSGKLQHSAEIKAVHPSDFSQSDHVLVYGGGESASDLIELLAATRARVTWAIPNGQQFFRKASFFKRRGPGRYEPDDLALDESSSPFIQRICPFDQSKPGMLWLCGLASTGSLLDYEGHGIPEWRTSVPFLRAYTNKNGHVVEHVKSGRVTARGRIAEVEGRLIRFAQGAEERFSHVILCSGYKTEFPFLRGQLASLRPEKAYKLIFPPAEPTLLFIGYARPTIGSIPLLTELQCRFAFAVLSGRARLPDRSDMQEAVRRDREMRDEYFFHRRRPATLVDIFQYAYDLAEAGAVQPSYARLFWTDPRAFWKTYFSPFSAAHFNLRDPGRRARAVAQIWQRQDWIWFVLPIVYLIARLLQVDRILGRLQLWRYRSACRE